MFKAVYKISPILSAQHSLQTEDAPVSQKANGDTYLSCKSGLHTKRRAALGAENIVRWEPVSADSLTTLLKMLILVTYMLSTDRVSSERFLNCP